jgi:hypothetical protein
MDGYDTCDHGRDMKFGIDDAQVAWVRTALLSSLSVRWFFAFLSRPTMFSPFCTAKALFGMTDHDTPDTHFSARRRRPRLYCELLRYATKLLIELLYSTIPPNET